MKIRNRIAAGAVAVAAGTAGLLAGTGAASAWTDAPGHASSAELKDGKVVFTYKNTIDRAMSCNSFLYPASKLATLKQIEPLMKSSLAKRRKGDAAGAQADADKGQELVKSLGDPLGGTTVPSVPKGESRTATATINGAAAAAYAGMSVCVNFAVPPVGGAPATTAIATAAADPTTTDDDLDFDMVVHDIGTKANGSGGSLGGGSLDKLLPF